GHSQGEVAAAVVAGALTLEQGLRIVLARAGVIAEGLAGTGAMASVALPVGEVETALPTGVEVAAVNAPSQTVIAGRPEAVNAVVAEWDRAGVHARLVAVDYASHTGAVDAVTTELTAILGSVVPQRGRVPFFSTVTGARVDGTELDAGYWVRNLRRQVCFEDAMRVVLAEGFTRFVEVSSHPVLSMASTEISEAVGVDTVVVSSLRRGQGALDVVAAAAAELEVSGVRVGWQALLPMAGNGVVRVGVPTYAFDQTHYWLTSSSAGGVGAIGLGQTGAEHPLLGAVVSTPDSGAVTVTARISLGTHPWLADHRVDGTVLVPGTALVDIVIATGDVTGTPFIGELTLLAPLELAPGLAGGRKLRIVTIPAADQRSEMRDVAVYSHPDTPENDTGFDQGQWVVHARGHLTEYPATHTNTGTPEEPTTGMDVGAGTETSANGAISETAQGTAIVGLADRAGMDVDWAQQWPPVSAQVVDIAGVYERLAVRGYGYGPVFQGLRGVWQRGDEVFVEAVLPESGLSGTVGVEGYGVHPALLDAVLHALITTDAAGGTGHETGRVRLPFAWEDVHLFASGAVSVRARIVADGAGVRVEVVDPLGEPVMLVGRLSFREHVAASVAGQAVDPLLVVRWKPVQPGPPVPVRYRIWTAADSGSEADRAVGSLVHSSTTSVAMNDPIGSCVFGADMADADAVGDGTDGVWVLDVRAVAASVFSGVG
ncbi:MAG: polyketide synthase dehydratase domain-containing protein, partial [Mycobacterium sp.]|nr:polyketide synthase dehydratase domain-containing protein [Mycobacterium sp.]